MRNPELDLPSLRFGLGRAFLLAANYFIGHQFVYPFLLSFVVLGLQPEAVDFPLWALIVLHTVTFVTTVWIALPLLKESLVGLRHNFTKTLLTPWVIFPLMYLTSIAVAMATMWVSGQAMPGNENAIDQLFTQSPMFTLALTIVFAPIVEELVFRGAFYRYFRSKGYFWLPILLSSLSFALIHISVALSMGNWTELWFLPLYGTLGVFLCVAYEKTGNLYGAILLHFIYNSVSMILAMLA